MEFDPPLTEARLIRRYKRFLADVEMADGSRTTVHCPNTGAMLGCDYPGSRVWLSRSDNPRRKYSMTWELVEPPGTGVLVGINTSRTNRLVEEALWAQQITELSGFEDLRREVRVEHGRLDFLLSFGAEQCYVEVKNVTAAVDRGVALFPDAASERASRHLESLISLRESGSGSVLLFCVQRSDVEEVRPAADIDPRYARTLAEASEAGVRILAYRWHLSPAQLRLQQPVRVSVGHG
ncbi:MAG: DNA/RNA nuclease SfsA [Xanthomonadales bacterium]|nr:DNA/RNA nuclease SfsA [Xanthomonadales bacterium]